MKNVKISIEIDEFIDEALESISKNRSCTREEAAKVVIDFFKAERNSTEAAMLQMLEDDQE